MARETEEEFPDGGRGAGGSGSGGGTGGSTEVLELQDVVGPKSMAAPYTVGIHAYF